MKSACNLNFRDGLRTAVLVASGPSALTAGLERARGWPVVAVNDAWRLVPWANALYACDYRWWKHHAVDVKRSFAGQCWTQCIAAAAEFDLHRIAGRHQKGLSEDPSLIYFNHNSGAQAMNLAFHWGARRFVLVGYDMGPVDGLSHFFGDHPGSVSAAPTPYSSIIRHFGVIAADCKRLGLEVINASPASRLPYFPRSDLGTALGD